MSHLLALGLLGVDCLVRAWRIQLAVWTAGRRLSFSDAFRLNLYGEAASQLTPNRLGGEPARFLGLAEARLRPVTALGAVGGEVAAEWPLVVPLPSGGGGLEVAFLNGFAGDFGARQVTMLLWWRFYTAILLTVLGVFALVRSVGYHAAVQLFKIGWGKRTGDMP